MTQFKKTPVKDSNNSILIIDDEPDILHMMKENLSDTFSPIFLANDGRNGLEQARKHRPKVIISDFHMPNLNGLELLKSLNEEGIKTPVIWTTGMAKGDLQKKAWMSGVYDIFEKPFKLETLRQCILGAMTWDSGKPQASVANLMAHHTNREVNLAIDSKNMEALIHLCQEKNISITTFLNQLIEVEIEKAS